MKPLGEAQHRARLVVLDLRGLTFLDAAGVHAIVDASIDARRNDRRLLLMRAPYMIQRAFELTGASGQIETFELGEAIAAPSRTTPAGATARAVPS